MTPLPKRKLSRQRQGKRRASIRLLLAKQNVCPNCGAFKKPHQVCPQCGQYKNKQVLKIPIQKPKKREDQT